MSNPSVCAIIATFNRAHFLVEAIESLLVQQPALDELIVVNDGSSDDTATAVTAFADRITYLEKENGGKSSALNLALRHQKSDYVWIFDDDDIALPGALAAHRGYLRAHPGCDFTYSPKYTFEGVFDRNDIEARPRPTLPAIPPGEFFIRSMESMHTMLQGMLISTRSLSTVGGFDEAFHRCQDQEMLLRLARRFCGGYVDTPSFAMRLHTGVRGPEHDRHEANQRSHVWQQYRQKLFTRIRRDLSLAEYLPTKTDPDAPLSAGEQRQATLQRGCIMALNSLCGQAVADFAQWRQLIQDSPDGISPAEQRLIARTTQLEDMAMAPPYRFYWQLGSVTPRDYSAARQLLRGVYWNLVREARGRHTGNAVRCVATASILAAAFILRARR